MAFSSKIENAIGDKIPVPQSWREVQQVNEALNDKFPIFEESFNDIVFTKVK